MDGVAHCPQHTVFNITELLEIILSNLEPLDLIRASGINRKSRCLVNSSSAVRQVITDVIRPQSDSRFCVPLLGRQAVNYTHRHGIHLNIALPRYANDR